MPVLPRPVSIAFDDTATDTVCKSTSTQHSSGNLDLSDAAVVTNGGKTVIVAAALYDIVRIGDPVTYANGGGTSPTAFSAGTVYVYKHATANTLSIFSTEAAASAPTTDSAAISAALDATTGAVGAAHTFIYFNYDIHCESSCVCCP